MLAPRSLTYALALCLVLSASPAFADNSSSAIKIVGAVVTFIGVVTENPALIKWGMGISFAGDACGGAAATGRRRRRGLAAGDGPQPQSAALRVDRADA